MLRSTVSPESLEPNANSGDAEDLIELARRAASGDDFATRDLLRAVWPCMTRVIAGTLGATHAEFDDVLQQSLIGLVRALPAFRGECHPAGYASRIALHTALRARRRAGLERMRSNELARLIPDMPAPSCPSEEVAIERRRHLMRDLLQDLPEEQADALALRIVLGWSLEEVALATGAPVNTVRSRVRLAKEALRRRIEQNPDLADDLEVEP